MQRRRWRLLVLLRKVLTFAICAIALVALLSVHVHVFPSSKVPHFSDPYKLPTQHDFKPQIWGTERSWTRELTPPHLSKAPLSSRQFSGARGSSDVYKLWKPPSNRDVVQCIKPSHNYSAPPVESQGYLLVHANGGLNQMRAGKRKPSVCVLFSTIHAIIIFCSICSNFSDVFDEDHFIDSLANDVKVVRKLPKDMATASRAVKHFRSWSGIEYYEEEIATMWEDFQVIRAAKSDSRLANNNLTPDIQKLRCRACYEALRFAPQIEAMGKLLVDRMRSYGPYIALHLRYEKDMLAFSGCTHDLSPTEADELRMIRETTAYWKIKDIDSGEQRSKGYCPLTPKEVGIFLAALGYPTNTPIYIAAGEIYGGDSHMANLQSRYPILMSKV
ncbi:hypothetical protein CJ030_MR3G020077 [Morella rubra]|uniref:O-fucosyltransferase family protein n=1 Tax=Morella rubra TaxID=262757 RepID=A0A6A1WAY6_9ROSI|nr:hypothetical protein CJ030_MR3G020077 [Morella rubra]